MSDDDENQIIEAEFTVIDEPVTNDIAGTDETETKQRGRVSRIKRQPPEPTTPPNAENKDAAELVTALIFGAGAVIFAQSAKDWDNAAHQRRRQKVIKRIRNKSQRGAN